MVATVDNNKVSDDDTMDEIVSMVHTTKMFDSGDSSNINSNSKGNGKPKEKRRNNEKRKERSRDAARCRRSRESEIFHEMSQELPLTLDDINQLDKASIMRIAIAYLKVRNILTMLPDAAIISNNNNCDQFDENLNDKVPTLSSSSSSSPTTSLSLTNLLNGHDLNNFDIDLFKQTLDGFLLILSKEGDIIYTTDNISDYLGISKVDIIGQPIWDFAHQCDHAEIKEIFNIKRHNVTDKMKDNDKNLSTYHSDVFIRLKCTLTSRGRNINIKSASYKVIHITGHVVMNNKGDVGLVAIGRPIPHPSNIQIPLGSTTFLTKHTLDFKFSYVDDKMFNLMGYKPEDLLETAIFDCHHGNDSNNLLHTFKNVLTKGQGETDRYRFLGKYGGYCWLVTQATVVYDKMKPQSVVCVNYVISDLVQKNDIFSLKQLNASKQFKELKEINTKNTEFDFNNNNNNQNQNVIENGKILMKQNDNESNNKKNKSNKSNNNNNNNENNPDKLNKNLNNINEINVNDKEECIDDEKENADKENSLKEKNATIIKPLMIKTAAATSTSTSTATIINRKILNVKGDRTEQNRAEQNVNSNSSSIVLPALSASAPASSSPAPAPSISSIPFKPQQTISTTKQTLHVPNTTVTRTIFENKYSNVTITNKSNAPKAVNVSTQLPSHTTPNNNNNKNLNVNVPLSSIPKIIGQVHLAKDKLPKTVTSSIIKPAAATATTTTAAPVSTATSTSTVLHVQPLNVISRAQSVTASVLTPFSHLKSSHAGTDLKQIGAKLSDISTTQILDQQPLQTSQQQQQQHKHKLSPSTSTATSPATATGTLDMNKEYLPFGDDAPLKMLKEEPPTDKVNRLVSSGIVGECLPLEETTPVLFGDMLTGFMDSYNNLLTDDMQPLDAASPPPLAPPGSSDENKAYNNDYNRPTVTSINSDFVYRNHTTNLATLNAMKGSIHQNADPNNNLYNNNRQQINNGNISSNNTKSNIDPFIIYGDDSNDTNYSQHLLSPKVALTSREGSTSIPSLCSPDSFSHENDFTYYTMNVDDMDDLTMRAPYIPMDEQDDLPLLTSDELVWYGNNSFTVEDLNMHTTKETGIHELQLQQQQQQQQQHHHQQHPIINYQQQQHQQQYNAQQSINEYSNSLCSSPNSTISSLSPSPLQQQQHHQQRQLPLHVTNQTVYTTNSSELAALLGGTGDGTLSILNETNIARNSSLQINRNNVVNRGSVDGKDESAAGRRDGDNHCSNGITDLNNIDIDNNEHTLCLQHFQHELQQQSSPYNQISNIDCKKSKYNTQLTATTILDDNTESIEQTYNNHSYNKDSNLDCWNEFVQVNTANDEPDTENGAMMSCIRNRQQKTEIGEQYDEMQLKYFEQQQQQQHQQQQNLIINAVPLIAIQSNEKNLLLPMATRQTEQQHDRMEPGHPLSNNKILSEITSSNNVASNRLKIVTGIESNVMKPNEKSKATFMQGTGPYKSMQQLPSTMLYNNNNNNLNNKRHMTNACCSHQKDSKRLKSAIAINEVNNVITTKTASTLDNLEAVKMLNNSNNNNNRILTSISGRTSSTLSSVEDKSLNSVQNLNKLTISNERVIKGNTSIIRLTENDPTCKWTTNNNTDRGILLEQNNKQKQERKQEQKDRSGQEGEELEDQQSNSVLKNLLISGYDEMKSLEINTANFDEANSFEMEMKYLNKSPMELLRNNRNNPLIGGPGMMVSPNILTMSTDRDTKVSSQLLNSTNDDDGNCISTVNGTTSKHIFIMGENNKNLIDASEMDEMLNDRLIEVANKIQTESDDEILNRNRMQDNEIVERNNSLNQSNNYDRKCILTPLESMDLCSDVCMVETADDEYMKEDDLETIFNELI